MQRQIASQQQLSNQQIMQQPMAPQQVMQQPMVSGVTLSYYSQLEAFQQQQQPALYYAQLPALQQQVPSQHQPHLPLAYYTQLQPQPQYYMQQGIQQQVQQQPEQPSTPEEVACKVACALGARLRAQGDTNGALQAYIQAVAACPKSTLARASLGLLQYEATLYNDAVATFTEVLQMDPSYADAYSNLGISLRELGRMQESMACYNACLRIDLNHPQAYNNLGNALKDAGNIHEASMCFKHAIQVCGQAGFPAADSNMAVLLKEQGDIAGAMAHCHNALRVAPDFCHAHCTLGLIYKEQGHVNEAIWHFRSAVASSPRFADPYCNLANLYKDTGMALEAILSYKAALQVRPDFPEALANLVHTLQFVCDWTDRDEMFNKLQAVTKHQLDTGCVPSVQPFHAMIYPCIGTETTIAIAKTYAQRIANKLTPLPACPIPPQAGGRLKVGFVSSDFGHHPLSHLMRSVFNMFDRTSVEVFCYALSPDDGTPWRAHIKEYSEHLHECSMMMTDQIAGLIMSHGIHVLVNLNGYTKGARNDIFALRPAPVQVSYLGFPSTSGADYIDYHITDEYTTPREEEHTSAFTEKLLYMPNCYFVNDHLQSIPDVDNEELRPTRESLGLPPTGFIFANFNQLYKIDPITFDCWVSILKRVPDSVLWLLRFPPVGEVNIMREAAARGLPPGRIIFTDVVKKDMHIRRCGVADLCLDTTLCCGHTTACDLLWSGLPMITVPGKKMCQRVAYSLVKTLGMPQMAVNSLAEYEEYAVRLATHPTELKRMRQELHVKKLSSPLFDTKLWTRHFEHSLWAVWRQYEVGLPPTEMVIPAIDTVDACSDRFEDIKVAQLSTPSQITAVSEDQSVRRVPVETG